MGKNKMKNLLILLLTLISFSCDDFTSGERMLYKCIAESGVNIFTEDVSNCNLVELLEKFEQTLQEEDLLSIANKNTYITLLKRLSTDSVYTTDLFIRISEKMPEVELISSPSNFYAILGCLDTHFTNNIDTTNTLYREYSILKSLLTEDTNPQNNDLELLEKMIKGIDDLSFKKSLYRLPILPFIYLYMESWARVTPTQQQLDLLNKT